MQRTQCIKSHAASDDTAVPGRGAQPADRHTELHGTDASTCCCYSESAAAVRWGSVPHRAEGDATGVLRDAGLRSAVDGGQLLRHRLDRLLQRLQPLRLLGDTRLQLQSAPRCPWLPTAPPFSCKRRALLGEVKLHESCANGTLCCSSSVCGDSDFLAIILTVCCSCRSAFNVAVVACTGRALR